MCSPSPISGCWYPEQRQPEALDEGRPWSGRRSVASETVQQIVRALQERATLTYHRSSGENCLQPVFLTVGRASTVSLISIRLLAMGKEASADESSG